MKVWIVIQYGKVDESDKIVSVHFSLESADAVRESKMVRIEGLKPWDSVDVEEWEVNP